MSRLCLFEAVGVEIEYMIVDRERLDVLPACDRLIEAVAGEASSEIERGPIAWSNELVLHVLELKTNGPAPSLDGLGAAFHAEVLAADRALEGMGGRLLPGGVHPWMDPLAETRLWPHEYTEVYRTFDRIFGCSGHGWSNLQSTHVNLPFGDDEEFGRLHAAIRVALALVPALAASSPFLDGVRQPSLDARLEAYRGNARRVPEVTGAVVPEPVRTEEEYRARILDPLYRALEPHDPAGVLRHEWANARGAIARFERGAIEIRVIDAQEAPVCDLAVVAMVVALVRALCDERWGPVTALDAIPTEALAGLFERTTRSGGDAELRGPDIARALGLKDASATVRRVWRELAEELAPDAVPSPYAAALEVMLGHGSLAERMVVAHEQGRDLRGITSDLAGCLLDDRPFRP